MLSRPDPAVDLEAVRGINDSFYSAFQDLDLDAMSLVWARRSEDRCIHPGWEPLKGWLEIREGWRAIFADTAFLRLGTEDVEVELMGDLARLSCIESVYSVACSGQVQARVAITHLFLRQPDGWRLTLRHGSPIAAEELDLDELDIEDEEELLA